MKPIPSAAAALVLAVLTDALGAGCGRKGSPRPPQYVIPQAPGPVNVTAVADGIKVSWQRPRTYADGTLLEDLGSFVVYRSCGDLTVYVPIARIGVDDRERFRKPRTFSILDAGAPQELSCRYRVVAVTLDDYPSFPAEGSLEETAQAAAQAAAPAAPSPGEPSPTPQPTPGLETAPDEPPLPAALLTPAPFLPEPFER